MGFMWLYVYRKYGIKERKTVASLLFHGGLKYYLDKVEFKKERLLRTGWLKAKVVSGSLMNDNSNPWETTAEFLEYTICQTFSQG